MPKTKTVAAAALLLSCLAPARAEESAVPPPAHNWTLPLFTKEGFRQMTLKGDEATPRSADRIDITNISVTVFNASAQPKVDTVLLSPQASFLLNEKVASGPDRVRVVRDDIEVTGIGWTYLYNEKKVLITRNAHVVFHADLPDILR